MYHSRGVCLRRGSLSMVTSLLVAVTLINCLAFTYVADQGLPDLRITPELLMEMERACFGLIPTEGVPGVMTVRPGRPACSHEVPVYESLFVDIRLTPGSWVLEIARLYSRTRRPLMIFVVAEVPPKLMMSKLSIAGEGWTVELILNGNSSGVLYLPPGESTAIIALRVRAVAPTSEPFRVGFHIATAG